MRPTTPTKCGDTMARRVDQHKGVFCLETDQWFSQKDRASVEPALEVLRRLGATPYEHRDVATVEEFNFFFDRYFRPGYKTHPILYLGFHGTLGCDGEDPSVQTGDGNSVTLGDLEHWVDGRAQGRLIYFGSCYMAANDDRLRSFLRRTRAVAVCGYQEAPDWLESMAFDLLALGMLQWRALTRPSIQAFDREIKERAPGLYERLGFRLLT